MGYLPALKRFKRVASSNKSGPFVGSEFAFEDLGSWEVKKYTYKYLRDDTLDGRRCFVVENTPAYEYSGYTRQPDVEKLPFPGGIHGTGFRTEQIDQCLLVLPVGSGC